MKGFWSKLSIVFAMQFSMAVWAYEIQTHDEISREAVEESILVKEAAFLESLGLDIQMMGEEEVKQLIRDGSRFEDNGSRPRNHFYDPVNNWPLRSLAGFNNIINLGETSPDWALEDSEGKEDIQGQANSYRDALTYFYDALTLPTETERNTQFETLFTTLGQVIHHLQDMAQPQHVRNDAHCGEWFCKITVFLHKPSWFENYTGDLGDNLPFGNRTPVVLDTARAYWKNAAGSGIAEFTNRNFVSDATNFSLDENGMIKLDSPYALPEPAGLTQTKHISELIPGTDLDGYVDFYRTIGEDRLTGETIDNPRASSVSIFDAKLRERNLTVERSTQFPHPTVVVEERIPTLNRFNFDAAHDFLIPRAVSYSTGLINHFFRGRLEVVSATLNGAELEVEVKNVSADGNDFMHREFAVYYDNTEGIRGEITAMTVEGGTEPPLAVGETALLTLAFPANVDETLAKPFVLVYRGAVVREDGEAGEALVAAVTFAATIEEPPLTSIIYSNSWYLAGTNAFRRFFAAKGEELNTIYESLDECRDHVFSVWEDWFSPLPAGTVRYGPVLYEPRSTELNKTWDGGYIQDSLYHLAFRYACRTLTCSPGEELVYMDPPVSSWIPSNYRCIWP